MQCSFLYTIITMQVLGPNIACYRGTAKALAQLKHHQRWSVSCKCACAVTTGAVTAHAHLQLTLHRWWRFSCATSAIVTFVECSAKSHASSGSADMYTKTLSPGREILYAGLNVYCKYNNRYSHFVITQFLYEVFWNWCITKFVVSVIIFTILIWTGPYIWSKAH